MACFLSAAGHGVEKHKLRSQVQWLGYIAWKGMCARRGNGERADNMHGTCNLTLSEPLVPMGLLGSEGHGPDFISVIFPDLKGNF